MSVTGCCSSRSKSYRRCSVQCDFKFLVSKGCHGAIEIIPPSGSFWFHSRVSRVSRWRRCYLDCGSPRTFHGLFVDQYFSWIR